MVEWERYDGATTGELDLFQHECLELVNEFISFREIESSISGECQGVLVISIESLRAEVEISTNHHVELATPERVWSWGRREAESPQQVKQALIEVLTVLASSKPRAA